MIHKLFVLGMRRAGEYIPTLEIQQMVGRCGRSYTESGEATLIVPSVDLDEANKSMFKDPEPIMSSMDEVENTAFHCIPAIYHKKVFDEDSFKRWFSRTLSFTQGKVVNWEEVVRNLEKNGCIVIQGGRVYLSPLGNVSYRFYFTPARISMLRSKLKYVVEMDYKKKEPAFTWLLACKSKKISQDESLDMDNYRIDTWNAGLTFDSGEIVEGFAYHCILHGYRPKWLRFEIDNLKRDFGRLMGALHKIVEIEGYDFKKELEVWQRCIDKKLPYHMGELSLNFDGATLSVLSELNEFGVRCKEDLLLKKDRIEHYGTEELGKYLRGKF